MWRRLRFAKRLVIDLPKQVRLSYSLLFHSDVPVYVKAAFATALGIIVTPFIDIPALVPFVGEIDMLALSILAMKLFVAACPAAAVAEVEQEILEQRSRFDLDIKNGENVAIRFWRRFFPKNASENADLPVTAYMDLQATSKPASEVMV